MELALSIIEFLACGLVLMFVGGITVYFTVGAMMKTIFWIEDRFS